jgi:hypothetical protein
MADQKTTIKTRTVGALNEMQLAQNRFAVAIKNHTADPSPENLKELQDAQSALYQIEDLYRDGRKLRLAHASAKVRRPR